MPGVLRCGLLRVEVDDRQLHWQRVAFLFSLQPLPAGLQLCGLLRRALHRRFVHRVERIVELLLAQHCAALETGDRRFGFLTALHRLVRPQYSSTALTCSVRKMTFSSAR